MTVLLFPNKVLRRMDLYKKAIVFAVWFTVGIFLLLSGCAPVGETPGRRPDSMPAEQQQPEEAMERFTPEWAYNQGVQSLSQENFSEAIRFFQLAIERDAMHLRAYLSLGDIYSMQQEYLVAETYYNKVLKYEPDSVPAYTALGTMHWKMGDYREALSFYRRVLDIDPSNQFARQQVESVTQEFFTAYYEQGMAYKESGDLERALIEFQKAQSLYPDDIEFMVEIGDLFFQQHDYMMAESYFQKALDLEPDYYPAIIGAGQVQQALRRYDEAIHYFKKGIEVQPGDQKAIRLLEQVQSQNVRSSLPPQYSAIANAEYVTRGDVAALLMVDLMVESRLPVPPRVAIISDVTTHWAKPYIIKAVQYHLMGLPPDRYFRPNEPIRKGELAFIIDMTLRELSVPLPESTSISFEDVYPENVYHDSVLRIYSAGIIPAESERSFGFVNTISGDEMSQIISRMQAFLQ